MLISKKLFIHNIPLFIFYYEIGKLYYYNYSHKKKLLEPSIKKSNRKSKQHVLTPQQ